MRTASTNIILWYLQDSENPILARQDWDKASEVFGGQTCNVIDLISRQEVVLVLAVAVVVVDVTRTDEKVGAWDMPKKKTPKTNVGTYTS